MFGGAFLQDRLDISGFRRSFFCIKKVGRADGQRPHGDFGCQDWMEQTVSSSMLSCERVVKKAKLAPASSIRWIPIIIP